MSMHVYEHCMIVSQCVCVCVCVRQTTQTAHTQEVKNLSSVEQEVNKETHQIKNLQQLYHIWIVNFQNCFVDIQQHLHSDRNFVKPTNLRYHFHIYVHVISYGFFICFYFSISVYFYVVFKASFVVYIFSKMFSFILV